MAFFGSFPGVRIRAIAAAVPAAKVLNDAFVDRIGAEAVGKFERMTGIRERRQSQSITSRQLASRSAQRIFEESGGVAGDVGALVFVSQTPDAQLPATACLLQHDLGLSSDIAAYDVNLGCSGFVYGLWQAGALIASKACQSVLVVGGDTVSRLAAEEDVSNRMLFGDAGFAALVERCEEDASEFSWQLGTDGAGAQAIFAGKKGGATVINDVAVANDRLQMDGLEVFNFTTSVIPVALKQFAEKSGQPFDSYKAFCFHQANKFILKQIAMLSGFSALKHLYSIDRFGNTSSASIPLTLCVQREKAAGKVLMAGFGVGLSWGIASCDFSCTAIAPVVEVEDP